MIFTKEYLVFFKELAANNNREWFLTNKKRYESAVKIPFEKFIAELLHWLGTIDETLAISPKQAILRINRDIRFAADKSPYNLTMRAILSAQGSKDKEYPGIYISMGPEGIEFYAGWYGIDKESLQHLRQRIVAQPQEFIKIIRQPDFLTRLGALQGDKNKVLPKDLKEAALINPIIAHKQFYVHKKMPAKLITSATLMPEIKGLCRCSMPLIAYLRKSAE